MRFTFRDEEKRELLKSWLAISVAFAIVISGGFSALFSTGFLFGILIAGVTVGLGFILHELAHKYVAQQYKCYAEFKADNRMLIIALLTSLFGIVFAAPGAVHISGHPSHEQTGRIAVAGPIANLVLALLFLLLYYLLPYGQNIAGFGAIINGWLALFNMLPFGMFDGAKVFKWNKVVYGIVIGIAVILAFLQTPLLGLGV